jgi:chromosome segregation ATPase
MESELKEVRTKMEKLEKQKNDFKQKYMNALSEAKELKEKLQQAQDQVTKLGDEIQDHKTDNEN